MLKHLLGSHRKGAHMGPPDHKCGIDASESTGDETGTPTTSSAPVDMDQFCEDASSSASVAPVEEENDDTSPSPPPPKETARIITSSRTSALTRAMALRQSSITKTFTGMIHDQLKVAEANKSMSSDKLKEFRNQTESAVKKQERMTKQFEALVHRLEQEAQEKETANLDLKRSLQLTHKMLKAEGLMNDAEIAESMHSCVKSTTTGKTRRKKHSTSTPRPKEREIFSITEIFCSPPQEADEIDDMTCHFLNDSSSPGGSTPPTTPSSGSKTIEVKQDILASELELLEV